MLEDMGEGMTTLIEGKWYDSQAIDSFECKEGEWEEGRVGAQ